MSGAGGGGPLLGLLSAAASTYARAQFGRAPVSFSWATVAVERVRVEPDAIVAELRARGPMNISARARAVVTVESIGAEEAVLRLAIAADHRTIGQVLESFVPMLAPRIEAMVRARGIAGVTIDGERITISYRPLIASLLDNAA